MLPSLTAAPHTLSLISFSVFVRERVECVSDPKHLAELLYKISLGRHTVNSKKYCLSFFTSNLIKRNVLLGVFLKSVVFLEIFHHHCWASHPDPWRSFPLFSVESYISVKKLKIYLSVSVSRAPS